MSLRREQLPLVTSFSETVRMWEKMDTQQRLGALAASSITLAGPVARLVTESRRDGTEPVDARTLLTGVVIDLRDSLDGRVARATDGVTPLGRELDPLADKIDFFIQELYQYRRGELHAGHVALRSVRDLAITALRSHVMDISDGQANVSAGWYGKTSTGIRQASLRLTGLAFEQRYPGFRYAHQTLATASILGSGVLNMHHLMQERGKFLHDIASSD